MNFFLVKKILKISFINEPVVNFSESYLRDESTANKSSCMFTHLKD